MNDADIAATFHAHDYFHFYAPLWGDDRSWREAEEICSVLALKPGDAVLDAPCGHGRISNELAARRMRVAGVDITAAFFGRVP